MTYEYKGKMGIVVLGDEFSMGIVTKVFIGGLYLKGGVIRVR